MTEKEKMLSGALYNAGDLELVWERDRAKALCEKLNVLPSGDGPARERVLSQLFGHTGGNIVVNSVFWCDYGYNIRVGDNFYVNHNCVILDCMPVTFGDNVMIGPNCGFYTASHPMDGAVIGAGSVVTRNIPPHVLAAGNPCRPVRPITQEDGTIQFPRKSKT